MTYRKWFKGPMRRFETNGSLRTWVDESQKPFFGACTICVAAFLIGDGISMLINMAKAPWTSIPLGLLLLVVGVLFCLVSVFLLNLRQILTVDIEKRTFVWRQEALITLRKFEGSLDGNCRFTLEEATGEISSSQFIGHFDYPSVTFHARGGRLSVPVYRGVQAPALSLARTLREDFRVPVEITSRSLAEDPNFARSFPTVSTRRPFLIEQVSATKLRIPPTGRGRLATKVTLLALSQTIFLLGLNALHLNGFADLREAIQEAPYVALAALVSIFLSLALTLNDMIVGQCDTVLEVEDGILRIYAESPIGQRINRGRHPLAHAQKFLFSPGNLLQGPALVIRYVSGSPHRTLLRGHNEETIRWVSNWLADLPPESGLILPPPVVVHNANEVHATVHG